MCEGRTAATLRDAAPIDFETSSPGFGRVAGWLVIGVRFFLRDGSQDFFEDDHVFGEPSTCGVVGAGVEPAGPEGVDVDDPEAEVLEG